jgi:tetratricopeptide (TPR) repeat protein
MKIISLKQIICAIILIILVSAFILLIVIVGICAFIFKIRYDYEHGYNFKGASHKYHLAMKEGDGNQAVIWAKKMYDIAQKRKYYEYEQNEKYIGYAYELNGEYEKALEIHRRFQSTSWDNFNISRVYYKLGRKEDAFKEYCHYADYGLLNYTDLKSENTSTRKLVLKSMYDQLMMTRGGDFIRLAIFLDYDNFLNFMEEEYTKLGSPLEYEEAIQLFRAIKNEIR